MSSSRIGGASISGGGASFGAGRAGTVRAAGRYAGLAAGAPESSSGAAESPPPAGRLSINWNPSTITRLRIGVDEPGRVPLEAYVLSAFSPGQWAAVQMALNQAAEAVQYWALHGVEKAMNRFNVGNEGSEK